MSKDRSSNFELLRLLCIFGILMMHTFGGIDTSVSFFNTEIHVLVNSIFNMGVTCFILLSGYFGIRFDFKKLIRLDLMIIFFNIWYDRSWKSGYKSTDQILYSGNFKILLVYQLLLFPLLFNTIFKPDPGKAVKGKL